VRAWKTLGFSAFIGQPNLNYTVDRDADRTVGIQRCRHSGRGADRSGANALTKYSRRGAVRLDLALSTNPIATPRGHREYSAFLHLLASASLSPNLQKCQQMDGAEEIYREGGQRYISNQILKCAVRDLDRTVTEAIRKVNRQCSIASGISS